MKLFRKKNTKQYGVEITGADGGKYTVWFYDKARRDRQVKIINERPTNIAKSAKAVQK